MVVDTRWENQREKRHRPIRARTLNPGKSQGRPKEKHGLEAHRQKRPTRLRSPNEGPCPGGTKRSAPTGRTLQTPFSCREKRVRPRVSRRPLSRSPHRDRRPQLASTEAINAGWSLLVLSPRRRRVCWGRHGTCFSLSAVRRRLAWRAVASEMEAAERSCCVGGVGAI